MNNCYSKENIVSKISTIDVYRGASLYWAINSGLTSSYSRNYNFKYYIDENIVLIATYQVESHFPYSQTMNYRLVFIDLNIEFTPIIDSDKIYLTTNIASTFYSEMK